MSGPDVRIGAGLLQVGRRQVDPCHLHARRGQPPRNAPMAAGRIEDAGAGRQVEQAQDLGRVGVRVRVVDRLLVEVEVVVAEGAPPCRTSCAIIAAGRVARMPGPEDISFDAASAIEATGDHDLFGATIHPLWSVGDKPNGAISWRCWDGPPAPPPAVPVPRSGRSCPPPSPISGRPPSARRPSVRRCCAAGGPPPTCAPCWPRAGRPGRRGARSRRPSGRARRPLRRHPRLPGAGPRRLRPPHAADPTGVYVGIMDVLDQRLDPATVPFAALRRGQERRPNCGAGRASPTGGSPMPCRCCSSLTPSRPPR